MNKKFQNGETSFITVLLLASNFVISLDSMMSSGGTGTWIDSADPDFEQH